MNGHLIKGFREKVLSLKETIKDEEFFTSNSAKAYLQSLIEAVCKMYNSTIKLILVWQNDENIAYATDRYELYLNVNNEFFHKADNRIGKLVTIKGLALHECGHLLFTDYHLLASSKKVFIQNRKLFPAPKCPEYTDLLTDLAVMDEIEIMEWLEIYNRLSNSIEDGFIEMMILQILPGEGQCLLPVRQMQYAEFENIKVQKSKGYSSSSILFNSILSLAKYGTVKMDADDKDDPAIKELLKNYDLIKEATETQKAYNRQLLINDIFCKMYKFFKEEKENDDKQQQDDSDNQDNQQEQNGSSDNQSGSSGENNSQSSQNGNNTPESGNNSNNQQNTDGNSDGNKSQNSNGSPKSDNTASSLLKNAPSQMKDNINTGAGSVLNDNNINNQPYKKATNNAEKMDAITQEQPVPNQPTPEDRRVSNQIEEEIASDKVTEQAEKELAEQLKEECQNMDYSSINSNCSAELIRNFPSQNAYKIYEEDMKEISFLVKKTVNEIRNKIKDKQQGGKMNGLYMGRYLDQHSLGRFDLRMLCKNDLPEDIPNMAITILIDSSGSMNGSQKIENARRTALLLYHFGLELNIPVMVYAHNCHSRTVELQSLADFGSVDGKDKYRICDITATGCNRDGMALRFCSEKLSKRKEEVKLMFVISDGLPSAYNGDKEAEEDIRNVLLDYSKKNVKYIAVGLGSDQKRIEHLYTQDLSPKTAAKFLSTDNSSELPVTIVRTIKEIIK